MGEKENIQIHHTAFLISNFRSYDEDLSQDVYAKLWNSQANEKWIKQYLQEVSTEEVYSHCLRNSYFLDTIKGLIQENKIEVLLNFGCGFSMYPYLIDEEIIHIEIDKTEVLDFKNLKIKE